MNHCHSDHSFTRLRQDLVVLAQPAVPTQPSERPLDGLIANDKFCLTRLLRMAP
jgi:hypothetical protein